MYRDLSILLKNVGDCLDEIFYFNAEGHSATVLDMSKDENREIFKRIIITCNIDMEIYENALEREHCLHNKLGYIITIPHLSIRTPATLGEEITHGEHGIHHKYPEYQDMFHKPTSEFIAFLGLQHVADKYGLVPEIKQSVVNDLDFNESKINHDIGHVIAAQLIHRGDVPYKDIFHSPSQRDVWKVVNRIFIPKLTFPVSKEIDNDALMRIMRDKTDSMGLKSEIELYSI